MPVVGFPIFHTLRTTKDHTSSPSVEAGTHPHFLFSRPAVAEIIGAGFDRPANAQYLTLYFPRGVKIHHDRSLEDTVDFPEYQRIAEASCDGTDSDKNEYHSWLSKLDFENVYSEDEVRLSPHLV